MNGRALVERLLADPPRVHEELYAPPEFGVWLTEASCYEFMADHVAAGARTLETGLGISTALFLALGAEHTCVVPSQTQVDILRRYCEQHEITLDRLHVEVGRSEDVLPNLRLDDITLFFIDGGHGFPTPMIDWFYGASLIRHGGVAVLDDRQLPAVAAVVEFLDADPRWRRLAATDKWAAFERLTSGSLAESWYDQRSFLTPPRPRWKRAVSRLRPRE